MTSRYTCRLVVGQAELEAALKLRRHVFVEEQGIPSELEFDGMDNQAVHMIATDGDDVIGTARLRFLPNQEAKVERMAVAKRFRRQGIGRMMLSFLIAICGERGTTRVILHAQYAAVPFYRSCGFEGVGEPFQEAGVKHLKMQMLL